MIRRPSARERLRVDDDLIAEQDKRIRALAAENRELRSLVRALTAGADLHRSGTTTVRAGYEFAFDLTPAEAALFDAIAEELP